MDELKVMPAPRHVDIAVTGACNLSCRYCFYADEMVVRSNLPTERWLAFFEELGRLGVMTVCLTGGEVFTRRDLFELIDGIISNRMRYSILSNGTLIDKKILDQFSIGKRRQRLDSIQVSVDGSREEVHDLSRPNSFNKVMKALALLKEGRFPIAVRVTVNRHNVDDLEGVARLLIEEVGLYGFSTNEAYACGATSRTEGGIILTPTQRKKAMEVLSRLNHEYGGRISAQAGPLSLADEIKMIDEKMARGETSMPGRGTLSSCGGVFNKLAILHDGTIVPCHVLCDLHLGVIGQNSLQDVWQNHPTLKALRERFFIPICSLETCKDCSYQGFCAGGCPGGALYANGDIFSRDPMTCYRVIKNEGRFFHLPQKTSNPQMGGQNE